MLRKWWFWAVVAILAVLTFYIKGYIDHAGAQVLLKGGELYAPSYQIPR